MIVANRIRVELKDTWPDLTQIWLTDPAYEVISKEWLDVILKECRNQEIFAENIWDCDNYALRFHACVQVYQYGLIKAGELNTRYSWAIGECIGHSLGFFGEKTTHSMNIAITDDGIMLIEPQDGIANKPNNDYTPFFVKF